MQGILIQMFASIYKITLIRKGEAYLCASGMIDFLNCINYDYSKIFEKGVG